MKQLVLVGLILVSAASAWAAPKRFPVSLKAKVQTDSGSLSLTDQNLVATPGNRLVLYIDMDSYVVAIEEWNAALTVRVDRDAVLTGTQAMLENYRMARIGTKTLMANLEMVDMDWDNDGEFDHDGNLQLIAKLKADRTTGDVTALSATLVGVLNDPVNSGNGGENMLFSGKLRTSGPAF